MIAGVILAGGKSSRMGTNKSQLKIANKSLLQHSQDILQSAGIKDVFISGKDGIQDKYANKGPLAGILASLEQLEKYAYVFFMPVDMPLINKYVILKLINEKTPTASYFASYYLPLIINNNLLNRRVIKQQLDNNILSIKNTLKQLDAEAITSHFPEKIFLNVNTESDWSNAQKNL